VFTDQSVVGVLIIAGRSFEKFSSKGEAERSEPAPPHAYKRERERVARIARTTKLAVRRWQKSEAGPSDAQKAIILRVYRL